jgi:hypothetical protein
MYNIERTFNITSQSTLAGGALFTNWSGVGRELEWDLDNLLRC